MVVLLDSSGSMRVVPQVWNDMGNYPYSYSAMVDLGFTAEGLLWISDDRGIFYYDPEAIMAVAEDRSPIYSWDPTEMTGGNARLMRVRGRRNDGVTHVYWTPLPENWDRMTQLPEEMTLHVAILDGTGTLQKDLGYRAAPGDVSGRILLGDCAEFPPEGRLCGICHYGTAGVE